MGLKKNDVRKSTKTGFGGSNATKTKLMEADLLALEPRILFDGAAVATGLEAFDAVDGEVADQPGSNSQAADDTALLEALSDFGPQNERRNEIAFVDTSVEGYEQIIASFADSIEIILIDNTGDGVEQIASVLSDRQDIDGIHIISHGRSGTLDFGLWTLDLGTSKLTAASMAGKYADEMAVIRDALDESGDILIYGCNFAQFARGSAAVDALAAATGADVAASNDLTGAAALGGDWDLEVKSGSIEAGAIRAAAFDSVLVAPTIDLDLVATAPVPGIPDTIDLDFSTAPVVTNDTQTEAVDGAGNGETAVYANVGTVNGQSIDLRAVVVSRTGPDVTFSTVGDDANIKVPGTVGVADNAVVRWEMVLAGTDTPVTGDFTVLLTDIDQSPLFADRFERISVNESEVDGYTLNGVTDITATSSGGVVTFSPTDQDPGTPGTDPTNAVQLAFSGTSSFEITYIRSFAGNFTLDGNFSAGFFTNPVTIDTNPDFGNTFTEGQAPVTVAASDMTITDDGQLTGATITLTNAQADDLLNAPTGAGLPTGITVDPASTAINIILTGTASAADYETAIKAITFENTSAFPNDTVVRNVSVQVTDDEALTSNIANSLLNVIDVPNDTDGDGVLDVDDLDDDNDGILDVDEGALNFTEINDLFNVVGSANRISATEVQLTPDANNQAGTIMSFNRISIDDDFTFEYDIFLGDETSFLNGADGIAFILHNDPAGSNAVGQAGIGIGATGIQDGVFIEFDTFNNTAFGATNSGDTVGDHTQIRDTDNSANDAAGAITAVTDLGQLEDSVWHRVEVSWDVATSTLSYSIDGVAMASYTDPNIANNRFGGSDEVFFGFSASTGGATNDQRVRDIAFTGAFADTDGDGVEDAHDLDSDNDGISDLVESGQNALIVDTNNDGVHDGAVDANGVPIVAAGGVAPVDSDLDGIDDLLDLDSDNDGISDTIEARPTAGYVTNDGDVSDNDADGDGVIDIFDTNDGTSGIFGGTFVAPENTDGVDNPDYLDTDSDNDLLLGSAESGLTLSGTDANNDGIDDDASIGVSYSDPDGVVNNPSSDLANQSGDTSEVGYREGNADPVAQDDGPVTVTEDTPVSGNVLVDNGNGADSDADGDPLTVTQFVIAGDLTVYSAGSTATIAGVGDLVINPDGSFTFTPVLNYNGSVPVASYTISDGKGGSDTADLTFGPVAPVNDPPVAVDDTGSTDEDTVLSVLAASGVIVSNDTDIDSALLVVSEVNGNAADVGNQITLASGALLTLNADGSYDYDPNGVFDNLAAGATASDSFTYTISDGDGGTETATVSLTIDGVNDTPSLSNDGDGSSLAPAGDFEDTYVENALAINLVDSDSTISDAEENIVEMVVILTDGQIGDTINFPSVLPGNISAAVVPLATLTASGTLTITFTGDASTTNADWNSVLQSMTFLPSTNDVHNPDPTDWLDYECGGQPVAIYAF